MASSGKEQSPHSVEDLEKRPIDDKGLQETAAAPLETIPSTTVVPPPVVEVQDGGFRAWLQVLGCFFLVGQCNFLFEIW